MSEVTKLALSGTNVQARSEDEEADYSSIRKNFLTGVAPTNADCTRAVRIYSRFYYTKTPKLIVSVKVVLTQEIASRRFERACHG